jgi:hypothetical protein
LLLLHPKPNLRHPHRFQFRGINVEQRELQGINGRSAQVFIVRIWSEARANPELPLALRGVIEHLPSGQKRYFSSVHEMLTFFNDELARAGIYLRQQPKFSDRIRQHLRQWFFGVLGVVVGTSGIDYL